MHGRQGATRLVRRKGKERKEGLLERMVIHKVKESKENRTVTVIEGEIKRLCLTILSSMYQSIYLSPLVLLRPPYC